MSEMKTPGGVPETLPADNKKDLHGTTWHVRIYPDK
jgi:hypothetical protein